MRRLSSEGGKICFVMFLLSVIGTSTAVAAPPRVVKAVPGNGATDVDPGLREIRVTFDQNMSRGASWVGGGPTFPKTRGKQRWLNPRTCVLPVKLEPNHDYWLSINSDKFKNFRNTRGEAARPYPISFATGMGKASGAKGLTVEENRAAITELRRAIEQDYSYRDRLGLNWKVLVGKYVSNMEHTNSPVSFAKETAKLLGEAKDMHIWIEVDDQTIGTFRRSIRPNYNMESLSRLVGNWRKESSCVWSGRFEDGIGYIMIDSWDLQKRDALEAAFEVLDDLLDAKGLIIDVRPNAGGSETLAQHFAGCFVEKPVLYAKHVYRSTNSTGDFGKERERVLHRKKGRPRYRGKVAVLMGPANMSSCEAFLLMMKQVPGCKLIGEPSFGSSGNPKPTDLGNGVIVFLPSWKAMRPDGSCFEGEGIRPDIPIKTSEQDLVYKDGALEAALDFLRKP